MLPSKSDPATVSLHDAMRNDDGARPELNVRNTEGGLPDGKVMIEFHWMTVVAR